MSLILEALKKLERDRHTQERGFLVLAAPAEGVAARSWTWPAAIAAAAALGGAVLTAALLRQSPAAPSASAVPATVPPAVVPLPAAATGEAQPSRSGSPARVAWPPVKTAVSPRPTAERRQEQPRTTAAAPEAVEGAEAEVFAEDPARPEQVAADVPATESTATLRLEAISQRDGEPVAVINGQVVRAGDRVGESTILRIGVAEVEVDSAGIRRVLRF